MPYLTQRAVFTHSGITSRCTVPIEGSVEAIEFVPGQRHVGGYQDGAPRPGARYTRLRGVQLELRGQAASGTQTPEGDIFRAAGFARSGSTGYTFALGDPHLAAGTPAGDTQPLSAASLNIDGEQWDLTDCVADLSFLFRAGQLPLLTCELLGKLGDSVLPGVGLRRSAAAPAVTVGPLPAAWQGASVALTPAGGAVATTLIVREIYTALRNELALRPSATGNHGFAAPDITARAPQGRLVVEAPPQAVIALENIVAAGTQLALSWSYTAGGSSFNAHAFSQTVRLSDTPRFIDLDGRLGYELPFVQDPAAGPLTFSVS